MVFHKIDLENINYIAKPQFLLFTPATKKVFALDTVYSYHVFYNQSVSTCYQPPSCLQKITRYTRSPHTKKIGNMIWEFIF